MSQCYKSDQGQPDLSPFTYDATGVFLLCLLGQGAGVAARDCTTTLCAVPAARQSGLVRIHARLLLQWCWMTSHMCLFVFVVL